MPGTNRSCRAAVQNRSGEYSYASRVQSHDQAEHTPRATHPPQRRGRTQGSREAADHAAGWRRRPERQKQIPARRAPRQSPPRCPALMRPLPHGPLSGHAPARASSLTGVIVQPSTPSWALPAAFRLLLGGPRRAPGRPQQPARCPSPRVAHKGLPDGRHPLIRQHALDPKPAGH
jgi:hypothetical protein